MEKQDGNIDHVHDSIASALACAQMEMGKALKSATNPHFKKMYADLGSVMDACLEPLNKHGIAVIQPTGEGEYGRYVKTILIHGSTGQTLECEVPLIVGKNDMQGYGSAVTYARRYGLMAMAGIAPEDDDGNAAAKSAPKPIQAVTPEQYIQLRDKAQEAGVEEPRLCKAAGCNDLQQFPADAFQSAMKKLDVTIQQNKPRVSDDLGGDDIPY